jgi:hypothetical protein
MADWSEMADAEPGRDGEHVSDELLSAFINNTEIDDDQVARAAGEHLARCDACRRKLRDLRAVVSVLAELPHPEPPRSFRLTPEMVPVRPLRRDPGYLRLQHVMRWAAAVAAVLLLLVFGTDIVIHRSGVPAADTVSTASQPAAMERSAKGPAIGGGLDAQSYAEPGAAGGPAASAGGGLGVGSAGSAPAAEAPAAAPQAAGSAASELAPAAAVQSTPSATTLQAPAASPVPEADKPMPAIAMQERSERAMPSTWALVELGLALIVVWLLVVSFALPRLDPWLRGRRSG